MSISTMSQGRTLAAAALFMAATAGTSFAQCPADDAVTTNNDCANAAPLALGAAGPFSVQGIVSPLGVQEDWWTFVVPAGEEITIDVLFTHVAGSGDVDLDLYDDVGLCGNEVDSAGSTTDNEQVTYANATGAAVTVTLRVFNFSATLADCADYSISSSTAVIPPDPCLAAIDDGEEENDSCVAAVVPSANPLTTLFVSVTDEDYYSYTLADGEILDIRLDYDNDLGDIDAQLIDTSDCTTVLVNSDFSFSDFEDLNYQNLTGAAQTVVLRVHMDLTPIDETCNTYDLSSTISVDPCILNIDDAEEENDTCATAVVPSANPLISMYASKIDPDYYLVNVPAGEILTVDMIHDDSDGNLDLRIFDATCTTELSSSTTFSDNETATASNLGGAAVDMVIEVTHLASDTAADCNLYDLSWTFMPDPCVAGVDDGEEENDTCLTPSVPSAAALAGLFVSVGDEDYYTFTLMPGEELDIDLAYINDDGDVDAELLASDCVTVLDTGANSFSDFEDLTTENTTAAPITVILRVFMDLGTQTESCNNYDMTFTVAVDPCFTAMDDMFEENDDCLTASPVSAGLQTGLFVRKEGVDEDWYSTDVLDGATLTVTASFINDDGDIDIDLFDACGGALLEGSAGTLDTEDVTWTNNTGATVNVKWGIFVWSGDPTEDCNNYDMDVDIQGGVPTNLIPFCFGDGSGTPCPCGNNSTAGHPGGCANSAGNGGVLTATGNPTVGADTLNLDLSSASQNSFALLVSGVNQLPQMGGCIGCGIVAFDGLRCAGGSFLRHGSRSTDGNGDTGNGWGPPGGPPGGLIAFNGFLVGQTRNFFAFYRDDDTLVCQTGQNSSNGIQITFN